MNKLELDFIIEDFRYQFKDIIFENDINNILILEYRICNDHDLHYLISEILFLIEIGGK